MPTDPKSSTMHIRAAVTAPGSATPSPVIIEAAGRAIFSVVTSEAPDAFHPAYDHDRDLWDRAAEDALLRAGHAALVDALTDLRQRFRRALILGGTAAEYADAACERADAALALARGDQDRAAP